MPDARAAVVILLNCCFIDNLLGADNNRANIAAAPIRGTSHPPLRNSFKIDFSGSIYEVFTLYKKKAPLSGGF